MKENPTSKQLHQLENSYRIAYLLAGYIEGTLTPVEHDELDRWVEASDANMLLFEEATDEANITDTLRWFQQLDADRALQTYKVRYSDSKKKDRSRQRFWLFGAAASIVVAVAGVYFFYDSSALDQKGENTASVIAADVAPGGNKAVLTLADGNQIDLKSAVDGNVAQQGGASVIKKGDGITYHVSENPSAPSYNKITTPRGGQYQLTLADGTKVWLNAASSLHFPTQFQGAERTVELNGEGYFEVAKNLGLPFKVITRSAEIQVVGTHFNISDYDEEGVSKTTLLEGKVRVKSHKETTVLSPGQQAQITTSGAIKMVQVDAEEAMAWKNGQFIFNNTPIQSIMQQVARWYDVDVVYQENISGNFNGHIPRDVSLTKLLRLLEFTKRVHFKLDGKKLIVTK